MTLHEQIIHAINCGFFILAVRYAWSAEQNFQKDHFWAALSDFCFAVTLLYWATT